MAESLYGSAQSELYRDGVVDVFHDVAGLHKGPPVVRDQSGVTVLGLEDVLHVTGRRDVHSSNPDLTTMRAGS
jgi:hypothetical protein